MKSYFGGHSIGAWVGVGITVIGLAVAPSALDFFGQAFYLDLLTRVLILAIAVAGLNLIVGYGGMVSLGHAAYIGIGAYSVGIPAYYEIHNGFLHLGIALAGGAIFALITGALCLRTRGLYFILMSLAFSQMLYFTLVSIEKYGADDGLVIYQRSQFGALDLENPHTLYYVVLVALLAVLFLMHRAIHARFGRVIVAAKYNDARMQALGYAVRRYQLVCYVLSGMICALAGFFLGNFTHYISPEMSDWTRSAELLFMLVVGGVGVLFAPLVGSATFLGLEEILSAATVHWHLPFGALLIGVVLAGGKGGLHHLVRDIGRKIFSRR